MIGTKTSRHKNRLINRPRAPTDSEPRCTLYSYRTCEYSLLFLFYIFKYLFITYVLYLWFLTCSIFIFTCLTYWAIKQILRTPKKIPQVSEPPTEPTEPLEYQLLTSSLCLYVSGVLRIPALKAECFQPSSVSPPIILSVLPRWGSPATCFIPTVSADRRHVTE